MTYVPILGFAPDTEETTPGTIRSGSNMVPTVRGMAGAPSPVNTELPELTATVIGAVSLTQLDGSVRTFAGTRGRLYEAGGNQWAERTRDSGLYPPGAFWRFAQLGNDSFATNNLAPPQINTGGNFEDITGAPRCAILEGVNFQLFALDTVDPLFGPSPDRWWASAINNVRDWTPSITTQSVSGRLVDTAGGITAGRRLFNDMVVYKERSLYIGRYVGPAPIWQFELVSDEVGAVSQEAVVPLESVHIFMGIDDFYLFDGARPRSIGGDIREFFFNGEIDPDNRALVRGAYNRELSRIAYAYPSLGSTQLDRVIYYNVRANRWGLPQPLQVRTLFEYTRPLGPTYDQLGDSFATYDDLPTIPYDAVFWSARVTKLATFNQANRLQTLDGEPGPSELVLWTIGQEDQFTFMQRARPRFLRAPAVARQVNSYARNLGEGFRRDRTATLTDGKFDFERDDRWHSLRWNFEGELELVGVSISGRGSGLE